MSKQAVLMKRYRVTFDRIGRTGTTPTDQLVTEVQARDADELSWAVFDYVKPKLLSREFSVVADLGAMKGSIEYGRFGSFTIEEIEDD